MHNMTIGQLRLQLEGRAARESEGPLWTGEMADGSFNAVTVRQRSDRQLLLSVYVQGRQIQHVAIGRFGTLEPPQPRIMPGGTPAVQRALKFMLPHVQRYTSGEYDSVAALKAAVREDLKSIPKLPPPPRVGWKVNRVVGVGAPDEDKRDAPTQLISKKTRLVKQPTVDSVPELEAELEADLAPKLCFPEPSKCTWDSLLEVRPRTSQQSHWLDLLGRGGEATECSATRLRLARGSKARSRSSELGKSHIGRACRDRVYWI